MVWFKVDDKLHDHRKARAAGATAMGVWLLAGSWSADNLTDGFIPVSVLGRWGRPRDATRLVEVGLWHADEQDGEKGWRFHEWAERQPTRAQKMAERDVRAKAGRAGGLASGESRRRQKSADSGADLAESGRETPVSEPAVSRRAASGQPTKLPLSAVDGPFREANAKHGASGQVEPPTRPDPTRPTDADASVSRAGRSESETPDRFDEFWSTYDHKVGRKKAEAAYHAALKKPGVTDDLLIAAAAEYVAWIKSEGKHPQYTKHPTTWLHGEHWRDERSARQAAPTRVQQHLALAEQLATEDTTMTIRQIGGTR